MRAADAPGPGPCASPTRAACSGRSRLAAAARHRACASDPAQVLHDCGMPRGGRMLANWLEWLMRALGSRSVARLADRVDGCTLRDSSGAETRRRRRSGLECAGKRCHDLAPPPTSGLQRGAHRHTYMYAGLFDFFARRRSRRLRVSLSPGNCPCQPGAARRPDLLRSEFSRPQGQGASHLSSQV
eukprot:COSAG06_NODE_751_length_12582_cov_40.259072_7_plen_185_part_00